MAWNKFDFEALDLLSTPSGYDGETPPLDPYLVWANVTQFRGFGDLPEFQRSKPGDSVVSVIAKATHAEALKALACEKWLAIPEVYMRPLKGGAGALSLFFTARVPLRRLGDLRRLPGVEVWELGLPVIPVGGGSVNGGGVPDGAGASTRAPSRSTPPELVIGVIDYGCAFMNLQFRSADARTTRITHLWDQGLPVDHAQPKAKRASVPWAQPAQFQYGRQMTAADIDALLATPEETDAYRRCAYLLSDEDDVSSPVLTSTHGTHVLDVAAGRSDPLTGKPDAASDASIVFVQLPRLTAIDSSGGSLAVHVLDAIRYILDVSAAEAKIVINLSYGTLAGPHDGSTLLERAMDDLLAARGENFAITLGAGNERKLRGHVQRELCKDEPVVLRWSVQPDDPTDSFLEVWYAKDQADTVTVQVKPPAGEWSGPVKVGQRRRLDAPDRSCIAAVMHEAAVPNGAGAMILVAQAPTEPEPGAQTIGARADAGIWEIKLATTAASPVPIDAWIERDDSPSRGPSHQSTFDGTSDEKHRRDTQVDEEGTLNSLATGEHTIVVGGFRISDGEEVAYSAHGPTRGARRGPDVLAACEENEALGGILAAAVRSGVPYRMNGTSVASPVVARRLFNAMCDKGPIRREDWKAVLAGLNPREVKPPPAPAAYQRGGKPRAITVLRASTSK